MILGERSRLRIRGIKVRLEEREKGLLTFLEILRKKEKGPEGEKRKEGKREKKPNQNQHPLEKGKEILHYKEFTHSNHL